MKERQGTSRNLPESEKPVKRKTIIRAKNALDDSLLDCLPGKHYHSRMESVLTKYLRKLARKGGRARKKSLSPKRRKQIAEKAAAARWRKK